MLSDFVCFRLTKRVVAADSDPAIAVVAIAGGAGCALACIVSEVMSKDMSYVNVIMSGNLHILKMCVKD